MATVNVTVGMTPEMLDDIDVETEKHDMSRAAYIRHCVRQANDSPFDIPDSSLEAEEDAEIETGTA